MNWGLGNGVHNKWRRKAAHNAKTSHFTHLWRWEIADIFGWWWEELIEWFLPPCKPQGRGLNPCILLLCFTKAEGWHMALGWVMPCWTFTESFVAQQSLTAAQAEAGCSAACECAMVLGRWIEVLRVSEMWQKLFWFLYQIDHWVTSDDAFPWDF